MATTKELDHKYLTPNSVEVTDDEVIIRLPKLPVDTFSESGKMGVIATTNGWLKTQFLGEFGEQLQVNLFVGFRK
jgi:hypothetical protein